LILTFLAIVPALFAERTFTDLSPAISGPSAANIGLNLNAFLVSSYSVNPSTVSASGLLFGTPEAATSTPLAPSSPNLSFSSPSFNSSGVTYTTSLGGFTSYTYSVPVPTYTSTYTSTYAQPNLTIDLSMGSGPATNNPIVDPDTLAMMNLFSNFFLNASTYAANNTPIATTSPILFSPGPITNDIEPEPQTIGLLAVGGGMLFLLYRRRKA
jgi:hypothetical protein